MKFRTRSAVDPLAKLIKRNKLFLVYARRNASRRTSMSYRGSQERVQMKQIVPGSRASLSLGGNGPQGVKESRSIPYGNSAMRESGKTTKRWAAARTVSQSQNNPSAPRRAVSVARLHSASQSTCSSRSEPHDITTKG